MKYEHEKELLEIATGLILHMKSLFTIHGVQYVEVFENNKRYNLNELEEVWPHINKLSSYLQPIIANW